MKFALSLLLLIPLTNCTSKPFTQVSKSSGQITSFPFTIHDNRLLVNVFLNGQGPFVMIFDVGSENILTPEVQKILELKSQGIDFDAKPVAGRMLSNVHLKTVKIGSYEINEQKFAVLDLNAIRKTFHFSHLDGVLGAELLKLARIRLNFDQQTIELLEPGAPTMSAAQNLKFDWQNDKPLVEGKINDQNAKILIDTGDRSNLTLFRKFAETSHLEKIFAHREQVLTGMGVAGPIPGKVASVQKVELGTAEVTDILARLPLTQKGYFFSDQISASIGIGFLKGFNVEFDSRRKVVALQPRKGFKETSTFVPVPRGQF